MSRTIYGVDFSGARLAGEKIWLAKAQPDDGNLLIEELLRADELRDSGLERDTAMAALVRVLGADANAAVGLDFPFSLAQESVEDKTYTEFLKHSAEFDDADTFKAAYTDARRRTDREGKTPFSPLNYRLYRQTFHGIRDVLRPLVLQGAHILPMMEPKKDALWLLEICPASTLKKEKLYLSYKGKSDFQRENRETILRESQKRFGIITTKEMDERIVADTEGDALDAVLAALGTVRGLQTPELLQAQDDLDKIEGRVYF